MTRRVDLELQAALSTAVEYCKDNGWYKSEFMELCGTWWNAITDEMSEALEALE